MSNLLASVIDRSSRISYRSLSAEPSFRLPVGSPDLPVLHFAAEREIFAEGDPAKSFYKVVGGVVRTCKLLKDGRRQIDAFYVEGDVFGFESAAEHGLSAEAVSDCILLPSCKYGLKTMQDDSSIALQMLSHAMRSLERTRAHSLLLSRSSATQKLAAFLVEMADSQAPAHVIDAPGHRRLSWPYGRNRIADIVTAGTRAGDCAAFSKTGGREESRSPPGLQRVADP
jgi:CRP/FNR family nitrogen fixation transcriptional regulator